jgi:hypothetical protein
MVHKKLTSLGIAVLNAEFAKMKADKGLMFRTFTKHIQVLRATGSLQYGDGRAPTNSY